MYLVKVESWLLCCSCVSTLTTSSFIVQHRLLSLSVMYRAGHCRLGYSLEYWRYPWYSCRHASWRGWPFCGCCGGAEPMNESPMEVSPIKESPMEESQWRRAGCKRTQWRRAWWFSEPSFFQPIMKDLALIFVKESMVLIDLSWFITTRSIKMVIINTFVSRYRTYLDRALSNGNRGDQNIECI